MSNRRAVAGMIGFDPPGPCSSPSPIDHHIGCDQGIKLIWRRHVMDYFPLILDISSAQRLADSIEVVGRTVSVSPSNIQNDVIVCGFPPIHRPPDAAAQLALMHIQLKPYLS